MAWGLGPAQWFGLWGIYKLGGKSERVGVYIHMYILRDCRFLYIIPYHEDLGLLYPLFPPHTPF